MMRSILLFLLVLVTTSTHAQTMDSIEDQILRYLDTIEQYRNPSYQINDSSISNDANYNLMIYLDDVCKREPNTLNEKFQKLIKRGVVSTSNDHKFRIYSWDNQRGGTMRCYNSILQYRIGKLTRTKILYIDTGEASERGIGADYNIIHTITTNTNRTIYLVERDGIYMSSYGSVGIKAFEITAMGINDSVKIFKTSKAFLNNIDCSYYYSDTIPNKLYLSKDKKTVYIPLTNANEQLTGKHLLYKFDGEKFVYSGVSK
ncbi:MAG: hypothetical protein H0X33_13700 [Taibaiella sp.]|nr:hypothetical protein [Taibaiella sp.]